MKNKDDRVQKKKKYYNLNMGRKTKLIDINEMD